MSKEIFLGKASAAAGIVIGAIGILLLILLTIAAGTALNGFVIQVMWGWFLIPLGLPVLGLANAMGLGLLIRYLTWQKIPSKEKTSNKELMDNILTAVFYPLLVLGLGFVVHSFM